MANRIITYFRRHDPRLLLAAVAFILLAVLAIAGLNLQRLINAGSTSRLSRQQNKTTNQPSRQPEPPGQSPMPSASPPGSAAPPAATPAPAPSQPVQTRPTATKSPAISQRQTTHRVTKPTQRIITTEPTPELETACITATATASASGSTTSADTSITTTCP